jgi:hypothetical protein
VYGTFFDGNVELGAMRDDRFKRHFGDEAEAG